MVEGYAFAALDSKVCGFEMPETVKRYKAIGGLSQVMSLPDSLQREGDSRQHRYA